MVPVGGMSGRMAMFVSGVVSTIVSLLGVQMGAARVVDEGTADFITYFGSLFAGIAVVLVWAWRSEARRVGQKGRPR